MNKKGFTLIEILAVIILIGMLIVIAVPSVVKISNKIKNKECENKIQLIKTAAIMYAQDNPTTQSITPSGLINDGYLKYDVLNNNNGCSNESGCIINPRTNEVIADEIIINKSNGTYTAEMNYTCE